MRGDERTRHRSAMPKRKYQDLIDRYENKIRKLQKLSSRRRIVSPIESSSEDSEKGKRKITNIITANVKAVFIG